MVAAYIAEAPEFTIERDVVCIKAQSGDEILQWHIPVVSFRIAVCRSVRVLADHEKRGEVVAIR